jgi:two-component system, LytTR family, sensor kinase
MRKILVTITKYRIHIIIWSLYTLYFSSLIAYFYDVSFDRYFVFQTILYKIGDIVLFYINAIVVFPKYLNVRKIHFLILTFTSLVASYIGYRYLLELYIFPYLDLTLPNDIPVLSKIISLSTIQGSNFTIFALGYYFSQRVIQQQKEISDKDLEIATQKLAIAKKDKELAEEREKNAILAKEKAQAEMAFLRAQINPHFLFNTLNLIYGKIITSTKEVAAEMMLDFSGMMQYATSTKMQEDTVDMNGEIDFVKKYLKMYKARNQQNAHIDYEEEGYFGSHRLVPMVLITIVENALKHGLMDDPENPLFIRVSLIDDFFVFMVRNLKNPYPKDVSGKGNTGVGIVNIIKRLNAVYQNGGFTLESEDLGDDYVVTFTVDYNLIKLAK